MIEILLVIVVGLLLFIIDYIKSIPVNKLNLNLNGQDNLNPNFETNTNPRRFGLSFGERDYMKQDPYKIVGIAHSVDPEEDSVYNLYSRSYFRDSSRYQYKVVTSGITIHINNSEPMDQLRTGDTILIPSKESIGDFTVVLEDKYFI